MITINITGIDNWERKARAALHSRDVINTLGKEVASSLRGSSIWPVDTGFSKANFNYRSLSKGVTVTNQAKYAIYVERQGRHKGKAKQTLVNDRKKISRVIENEVARIIDG